MTKWADLSANLQARGINIKWIANDKRPGDWHLGGFKAGAEGAIITGPISGMVHTDFKGIWHEPAYGPPRYERKVDQRREISTRITIFSDDSEFGWFDNESKFWDGMDGENPGFWSVFTHRHGELYIPMQLVEVSQTPLDDDPSFTGNAQEWDILLAADGDPRWRQPDLRPPEWVNDMSITKQVKRDDERHSPNITVGVGTLVVANRGTEPSWPVYTVTAPGRCWLPNGMTGEMVRVPKLNMGEHVTIDTNPEHRIAIADTDPIDSFQAQRIRNSELLSWLFGQFGETGESGLTILERFHGQGFDAPIPPNTVATLPVFHSQQGARVSVRLPQRFERAIS